MRVWHLKTCDTCRKAIRALHEAGHGPELIDVRTDGIDEATLARLMAAVGRERLLNTRSTTWRGLDETDRTNVDDAKAIRLILVHPTLMKRPVIDTGDAVYVGWTDEVRTALL